MQRICVYDDAAQQHVVLAKRFDMNRALSVLGLLQHVIGEALKRRIRIADQVFPLSRVVRYGNRILALKRIGKLLKRAIRSSGIRQRQFHAVPPRAVHGDGRAIAGYLLVFLRLLLGQLAGQMQLVAILAAVKLHFFMRIRDVGVDRYAVVSCAGIRLHGCILVGIPRRGIPFVFDARK